MPTHPPMLPRREGHTLRIPLLPPEKAGESDHDSPHDEPTLERRGDSPRASSLDDDTARAHSGDSASPSSETDTDALWPQPSVPSHRNPGLETLDYEPVHNDVMCEILDDDRRHRSLTKHFYGYTGLTLAKYALTIVVGVCTGLCAAFIDFLVDEVYALKQWLILVNFSKGSSQHAFAANASAAVHRSTHYVAEYVAGYTALCLALALAAASLCLFWAPQAQGGGVTSVMAYLNGTAIPGLLSWRSLCAKVFGVAAACGSSLAVGPEGPMVHIGAAMASVVTLAMPRAWLGEVRGGESFDDDDDLTPDGGFNNSNDSNRRHLRKPSNDQGDGSDDDDFFDTIDDAASLEESRRRGDLLAGTRPDSRGGSRRGSFELNTRRARRLSRGGSSAYSAHRQLGGSGRHPTRRASPLSRLLLDLASHATQVSFFFSVWAIALTGKCFVYSASLSPPAPPPGWRQLSARPSAACCSPWKRLRVIGRRR